MMYAGVKDVRILNGSIAAWSNDGYPLSREAVRPSPVSDFGTTVPARPEIFIDTARARTLLASDQANLVSVRSWNEFIGKVSGYHYIFKRGRIPGALFGNCGSDAYHMENYRNPDLTTREYHEIKAMWERSKITPDRFNAFYCGTGWRASEAYLNAYVMGWEDIAVYDATGSRLFEQITRLEEYYPGRTEKFILKRHAQGLMQGGCALLVELGSGDCTKISLLLRAIPAERLRALTYIPFDVSRSAVESARCELEANFGPLQISGIVADFMRQIHLVSDYDDRVAFLAAPSATSPEARCFGLWKPWAGWQSRGNDYCWDSTGSKTRLFWKRRIIIRRASLPVLIRIY